MNQEIEEIQEIVEEPQHEKITLRQQVTPEMLSTRRVRKMFGIHLTPYRREYPKIGRNEPCPCGSGQKYKKCCLN